MIKLFYSLFIGILLAIFVGVGISVFYESPEYPEEPASLRYGPEEGESSSEFDAEIRAFDEEMEAFEKDVMDPYERNVSIAAMVSAVVFLAIGMFLAEKISVIADGMLLGGVFTLFYGMMRGLATDSDVFRFSVITLCLAIAIALGYWKFRDKLNEPLTSNKEAE